MTTLHQPIDLDRPLTLRFEPHRCERRRHRRHDLEHFGYEVGRWEGRRLSPVAFGQVVDLSASGVRIRSRHTDVRPHQQIRIRLELPTYAGICPFVDTRQDEIQPMEQWTGWLAVSRVRPTGDGQVEIAGRLIDMEEINQGMLRLYLSTQPLAA